MDELNGYVILAGVVLILAVLAYAGYTDVWSRIRGRKTGRQRQGSASRRRQ